MAKTKTMVNFLERNILELTKTTVLLIIYIGVNDVDTYYNVGVEIAIEKKLIRRYISILNSNVN